MAHIQNLYDSTQRHDPVSFLTDYLTLVVRGTSLTLPKSLEQSVVQLQWQDCLPAQCGEPTAQFLEDLSHLWIKTVQQQGAKVGETFPQELLDIMLTKTAENTPLPSQDTKVDELNEIKQVTSSISTYYKKEKKARKQGFSSPSESIQMAREALKKEDTDTFILSMLQLAIKTDKPLIPLSNDTDKVEARWELIISKVLKIRIDKKNLQKLTGRWLQVTTKKGIPKSKRDLKEIIYFVRATKQKPEPVVAKNGFLDFISKFFK